MLDETVRLDETVTVVPKGNARKDLVRAGRKKETRMRVFASLYQIPFQTFLVLVMLRC